MSGLSDGRWEILCVEREMIWVIEELGVGIDGLKGRLMSLKTCYSRVLDIQYFMLRARLFWV